jgi:hypothetical protein
MRFRESVWYRFYAYLVAAVRPAAAYYLTVASVVVGSAWRRRSTMPLMGVFTAAWSF